MNLPHPCYWGKLPAYGDFVRHGASSDVQQAWRHWLQGPFQDARQASRLKGGYAMPWSFILTPGCLGFSRDRYVAGVYAPSHDKFGREHPFLMWFQLPAATVSALLSTHDNALFCLSRLVRGHLSAPASPAARGSGLVDQINRLWRAGGAGVWGALRRRKEAQDFTVARTWADGWPSDTKADGLAGVPYAPWRNWPSIVFGDPGQAWYWQQDVQAGYVSFLSVTAADPADLARGSQ
ncbi:type VI secretion system-associated protein TagF [Achromobacter seleniivolatilans]|uniref:Type VI secretion system-associated protein TagF n=1 Tax=Achromobacter seleniivolatilans TaxID=3047478 RepID=A0ABY9M0M5_9BURK|nr:type VI secretion system-associated protein TagF [Achromobacter sp. R39]WMD20250.1 type VI secretion system-associated protein TagF [Achromobacter sp. R39]